MAPLAAWPLALTFLLAGACGALASPLLQVNSVAVVRGTVVGLSGSGCAMVEVELEHGSTRSTACPNDGGIAAFALLIRFPDSGASRLGRLTVSQPANTTAAGAARVWRQFIQAGSMQQLPVDMRQAAAVEDSQAAQLGSSPVASHSGAAAPTTLATPHASCRGRWIELEDIGDTSLPVFLAMALGAAPTCLPPTPYSPPPTPLPASTHQLPMPTRLLLGLGACIVLQTLALAALLLSRRSTAVDAATSQPAQQNVDVGADGGAAAEGGGETPQLQRRPSLRDACTSPFLGALLGSPFALRKAWEAGTDTALKETVQPMHEGPSQEGAATLPANNGQEWEQEEQQEEQEEEQQGQTGSDAGLAPPPAGWSRDAWGRLQRQGRRSGGGGKRGAAKAAPAAPVYHPPPFGSTPGTAYRRMSEE